jgi:hypothetical protein
LFELEESSNDSDITIIKDDEEDIDFGFGIVDFFKRIFS